MKKVYIYIYIYIYIDEKYSLSWNTLFHITHPAVTFLLPFLARRPGHGLPSHLTTTILQIFSNSKFSFHLKKSNSLDFKQVPLSTTRC
jgi:hypothetical protein